MAETIKNPPATQDTWVQPLGWEDPLEKGMAAHSSILAWRIPVDRGAWRATAHGIAKSRTRLSDQAQHGTIPSAGASRWPRLGLSQPCSSRHGDWFGRGRRLRSYSSSPLQCSLLGGVLCLVAQSCPWTVACQALCDPVVANVSHIAGVFLTIWAPREARR